MSTIAKDSGGKVFAPAPAGSHRGVCFGVIDLGTQEANFNGEISYPHKVLLMFELSDEQMEDGRPFMVSKEFTLSLNEKAKLLPFLNSWRGRPFSQEELKGWDLTNVLGAPALLNVIHGVSKKGRTFADLAAAMPLPKGMTKAETINDLINYQIEDGDPPESLPQWVRDKIAAAQEFKGTKVEDVPQATGPVSQDDDDLPF